VASGERRVRSHGERVAGSCGFWAIWEFKEEVASGEWREKSEEPRGKSSRELRILGDLGI